MGWSRKRVSAVFTAGLRNIWSILFWGMLLGTVMMLYTVVLTSPSYTSQASVYVSAAAGNSDKMAAVGSAGGSAAEISDSYGQSYLEVMTSEKAMKRVRRSLDSSMETDALAKHISVKQNGSTAVFYVTASYEDAQSTRLLAQAAAEAAVKTLDSVGVEAYVLDAATLPLKPDFPKPIPYTIAAMLVGMVVRWIIAMIAAMRDHTLRGAEDWEAVFDIPVLAEIPERGR